MYEVWLWIPTKGWKTIVRTKNEQKAIEMALTLVPLEVRLLTPEGRSYYSGILHCRTMSDKLVQMEQIEDYAYVTTSDTRG